ncbi:MAG: hypothetical protein FWE95_02085 [Planctomycetaceae bacterium]|nr:hypothetical protein [Planctomycetaceae bacterium]
MHLYTPCKDAMLIIPPTPTNNVAEQGVRSDAGNEWHERFRTTVATCRRLGMNVMSIPREAIFAMAHGLSPPSFLPQIAKKEMCSQR